MTDTPSDYTALVKNQLSSALEYLEQIGAFARAALLKAEGGDDV